ncbi:hypothetical protein ABVF61_26900 [Roseibium sp. HPY-6]|uniref:hypothetical protein n=1 Tax=Roseibium sp. HPY-6 TaxID=3229852 RepID=UPI00338EB1EC
MIWSVAVQVLSRFSCSSEIARLQDGTFKNERMFENNAMPLPAWKSDAEMQHFGKTGIR